MTARVEVRTGARTGAIVELSASTVEVGRNPEAGLRFDPQQDLAVSGKHAVFTWNRACWVLEDLGSRNGTFVNGHRVEGPVQLRDGDTIRFGENGPEVRFRDGEPRGGQSAASIQHPPQRLAETAPKGMAPAASGVPAAPPPPSHDRGGDSGFTRIVRARVALATRRLRWTVLGLTVVLLGTASALALGWFRSTSAELELRAMRVELDSILSESRRMESTLRGESAGLATELERSRIQLAEVQSQLAAAEASGGSDAELDDLRRELLAANAALQRQQLASNLDYQGIENRVSPAIVRVYSDLGDGQVVTATGFAVDASGIVVTSQHVVETAPGSPAVRIGIQFSGSSQTFPGRLLATSEPVDLAILQVDRLVGTVPTVGALNERPDTVEAGRPVLVLGYPLGGLPLSQGPQATVARPLTSIGILSASRRESLELVAFGAEGSSGSPIFDEGGQVIGVLYGGAEVDGQRRLLATPSDVLLDMLANR